MESKIVTIESEELITNLSRINNTLRHTIVALQKQINDLQQDIYDNKDVIYEHCQHDWSKEYSQSICESVWICSKCSLYRR